MKTSIKVLGLMISLASTTTFLGCSMKNHSSDTTQVNAALRPLSKDERQTDFDALVMTIKNYYGPLNYKEARFGFKFDDLVNEMRPQALAADADAENFGVLKKLLARFHDGHVSIRTDVSKTTSYTVPLIIFPVEDKALVAKVLDPNLTTETGIEAGDEIVEVDGQATMSYLPTILKYESFATDESNKHWILRLLRRPTYITELKPTKSSVTLKIAKKSGDVFERTLIWKTEKNDLYVDREFTTKGVIKNAFSPEVEGIIQSSLLEMGAEVPFFASNKVEETFKLVRVNPSEKYLKKYGLTDSKKVPTLYAAIYRYDGKNLLLVRQPTYSVTDAPERIAWFKAVLDEYGSIADALVLDQTHNPGGSLDYAQDFVSLFARDNTRNLVNFLHADRKWLAGLGSWVKDPSVTGEYKNVLELGYKLVESAYDRGLDLTESPIALTGLDYIKPSDFTFKKPVLMLIDELAGSCGDIVPLLMKDNGLATLFGERTMGLGGNVETGIVLPNSQATVKLTRGFFMTFQADGKYDLGHPTENNGVTPNIPYQHTVKDTRAGYVDYVTAFSKAAAALK